MHIESPLSIWVESIMAENLYQATVVFLAFHIRSHLVFVGTVSGAHIMGSLPATGIPA